MNISQIFTQALGRQPTAEEAEYFGGMLDRGDLTPTEFLYFLGSDKEIAQQGLQQLASTNQAVRSMDLGASDTLNKYMGQAQSQYAKMGRQSTSALDVALASKMSELALQRRAQFSNLMGQAGQGNIQYARGKAETGRAQDYQTQAATTSFERQKALNEQQYNYQRTLAELSRKWQKEDTPSFMESLVPSLISGGVTLGAASLGKPKYTNYYSY